MKPYVRLLALLALLGLAACGTSDTTTPDTSVDNPFAALKVGADSTLEVMTWNLENFPLAGGTTVALAAQAVAGLDVDIVAMQEVVGSTSFDQVLAALDGWQGFRADSAPYDQNLAFVYREGGGLENVAFTEIFTHDSREFPRSPLVLSATWHGVPIVVINNHLKCCGDSILDEDDVWDETTRRRDACVMLDQYVQTNYPDTPVVIVGDWNDELEDAAPADNVFANFLDAPDLWLFADLPVAIDPLALKSYPKYGSHIDHILITDELFAASTAPGALAEVVALESVMRGGLSAYYRDLSDHRPVVLRLAAPDSSGF